MALLLLLKSGKQMVGLSSKVAKSQRQQLGLISAAASNYYYLTTTKSSLIISAANTKYFSSVPTNKHMEQDNDFEIPPMTLKRFFTSLFGRRYSPPPPPPPTPFQELIGRFMDLAEESKYYSEDRLPRILDDIRPILNELLDRMTDESIVKFLYEFARPAAASPPVVIDRKIKELVDKLPAHVINLFQDIMADMLEDRYHTIRYRGIRAYLEPERPLHPGVDYIADVSHIGKEHLRVFVVDDLLLVTGTDKAASPPAPAYAATPKQIIPLVRLPYLHDNVTASILEDQGGVTQLKIVFPRHHDPQVVNNKPRVFQINLDNKGTHQG